MFIAIFIMAIMKVFVKLQPLAHLIRAQLLFSRQALPPHVWDAPNSKDYIYTAYGSTFGTTNGLRFRDDRKTLKVSQNLKGIMNEVVCLNESGVAYCYVCIR